MIVLLQNVHKFQQSQITKVRVIGIQFGRPPWEDPEEAILQIISNYHSGPCPSACRAVLQVTKVTKVTYWCEAEVVHIHNFFLYDSTR